MPIVIVPGPLYSREACEEHVAEDAVYGQRRQGQRHTASSAGGQPTPTLSNGSPDDQGPDDQGPDDQGSDSVDGDGDDDDSDLITVKAISETTIEDVFESAPVKQPMKCEIKRLEKRAGILDGKLISNRMEDLSVKPKQKHSWQFHAICMVDEYDKQNRFEHTSMYINSEPLRQLARDVFTILYENVDLTNMHIPSPFHTLFFYRKDLEQVGRTRFKDDKESNSHLTLLLDWINKTFEGDIRAHNDCTIGGVKTISYKHLWTLFPLNSLAYANILGQHRLYLVCKTAYSPSTAVASCLSLHVKFIDFDGDYLGQRSAELVIPEYPKSREINSLNVSPLTLRADAAKILDHYDGIAIRRRNDEITQVRVKGRIMVDCKTYKIFNPSQKIAVSDKHSAIARAASRINAGGLFEEEPEYKTLTKEQHLITNSTVRGFSLSTGQALEFFVHQVDSITWKKKEKCFDELLLHTDTKETLEAMIGSHESQKERLGEIPRDIGQGLVFLFHGPPGVGKTLTAECMAEYLQRPLRRVTLNSLGMESTAFYNGLSREMQTALKWNAILFMEDADAFLQRPSLTDQHPNRAVGALLRLMENFPGILIFSANRVDKFNEVLQSRVNLSVGYSPLSWSSRLLIWNRAYRLWPTDSGEPVDVDMDTDGYYALADYDLNGRQIKNIFKAAESRAAFTGTRVDLKTIQSVIDIEGPSKKD
ncbi:P-loop containing nucleoside triphosphate hydrolase protein [Xylaria palmicola]|nr:P-loop containing nucleoside triphosphate hydrolase protein [Xylaria palmicola]